MQDKKLLDELFRPGGPLGDFGVKVDLGYLRRIYSKGAWKELDTITKIRNAFAHKMEVRDFSYEQMRGLANNLTLWETKPVRLVNENNGGFSITLGPGDTKPNEVLLCEPVPQGEKIDPKVRFINACKFYLAAFTLMIHMPQDLTEPIL